MNRNEYEILVEGWRSYLNEGMGNSSLEMTGKFTGIIQVVPSDRAVIEKIQQKVLEKHANHKPIQKLHITLLHQKYPKKIGAGSERGDKLLKALYKSGKQGSLSLSSISFGDIYLAKDGDRESTYVVINEQDICKQIRDSILEAAGIEIKDLESVLEPQEASRVYHISLTNLTGNGGDSVAYPKKDDEVLNIS